MASKPLIALARWADQIGANLVPPTSGERDLGFGNGSVASSGKVNTELNQLYQWALYLSDGNLSGDHTIAGNLTVGPSALTFTDFTFTADSTTDQLAATGNPLQTGDGPVRTSNSGGALPGGLAAATDYYWIKVDADHGRAATSRANALAGVFIDITSNGTGTQTLQHQTGTTRANDAEVTRNLQVDGVVTTSVAISAPAYLHPTQTIVIPGSRGLPVSASDTSWDRSLSNGWFRGSGIAGDVASYGVSLPRGETITAIRAVVTDSATNSGGGGPTRIKMSAFVEVSSSGLPSFQANLGTPVTSAGSGSSQIITLGTSSLGGSNLALPYKVFDAITIGFQSPDGGTRTLIIWWIEIDCVRLL